MGLVQWVRLANLPNFSRMFKIANRILGSYSREDFPFNELNIYILYTFSKSGVFHRFIAFPVTLINTTLLQQEKRKSINWRPHVLKSRVIDHHKWWWPERVQSKLIDTSKTRHTCQKRIIVFRDLTNVEFVAIHLFFLSCFLTSLIRLNYNLAKESRSKGHFTKVVLYQGGWTKKIAQVSSNRIHLYTNQNKTTDSY